MVGLLFFRDRWKSCWVATGAVSVTLLWTGCSDPEPRVYRVERTERATPTEMTAPASGDLAGTPEQLPPYRWEAPEHWQAQPLTSFRVGSYRPAGDLYDQVDISVTTFSGFGGDDLANVNRWRDQIGLPHLTREQLQQDRKEIPSGMGPLAFYDYTGESADNETPFRIAAAIYRDATHNVSWFFRISGPQDAVAAEMPHFQRMVATFATGDNIGTSSAQPASNLPAPSSPSDPASLTLSWTVPADWKETTASEKQTTALFRTIAPLTEGGVQTIVSRVPQSSADLLGLVNQWRSELQLNALTAENLDQHGSRMEINGLPMFIVDIQEADKEKPKRILGSIFPHHGDFWLIRTEGDESAVQGNLQHFITFLSSLRSRS